MKTRLIYPIICLSMVLCACNKQMTPLSATGEPSVEQPLPTTTYYPTQTMYPTQTPLPTSTPMPVDISSAQPLPSDSIDWGLTYNPDGYHPLVTWWNGNELKTKIHSGSPDGKVSFHSTIDCADQPYGEYVLHPILASLRVIEDAPVFGDKSIVYSWAGEGESYSIYFIQKNCFVSIFTQNIPGIENIYQMAHKVEEQLPQTTMNIGLAFPSYDLDAQAFYETMMFVEQTINKDSARFEVKLSTKKPFIRVLTLAVYDKTDDKFLSRTDHYNHSFLSPAEVDLNLELFANPSHQYQLWIWVEDKLVYIGDFVWEK